MRWPWEIIIIATVALLWLVGLVAIIAAEQEPNQGDLLTSTTPLNRAWIIIAPKRTTCKPWQLPDRSGKCRSVW